MSEPITSKELVDAIRERHELNWTGAEHMQTQAEIDRRDLLKEISRLQRAADEPLPAHETLVDELIGMVDEAARDKSVTACSAFEEASAKEINAARDRVLAAMCPSPPPPVEQLTCTYEMVDGPFLTGCGRELYLDVSSCRELYDFCPHCGKPVEETTATKEV